MSSGKMVRGNFIQVIPNGQAQQAQMDPTAIWVDSKGQNRNGLTKLQFNNLQQQQ
jgi:hypothetical protein